MTSLKSSYEAHAARPPYQRTLASFVKWRSKSRYSPAVENEKHGFLGRRARARQP